jgi:hypothetical protein
LRSPTRFGRYRGSWVPFACFSLSDSFSTIPRASGSVFLFCTPGLFFNGTEDVLSRLHVLRSRTLFRWYRGRQVLFSSFVLPDSFWAVPKTSDPVFHLLRFWTRFRRYRGYKVSFSCFALLASFSTVPRMSGPIYNFALPDSYSAVPRASGPVFMFYVSRPILGGTGGVGSSFHVLRSRTHSGRYFGPQVLFSSFTFPDPFWAVHRASGPVFIFCSTDIVWGITEGVGSRFHVLRSPTLFWLYRGHRVQFSCFALPESFRAVLRASDPVFMFCVPDPFWAVLGMPCQVFFFYALGLFWGGFEGASSHFHVLCSPDPFWAVPRASGPILMFCVPRPILGCTGGVVSSFHVLRS